MTLLATKLHIPPLRARHVPRARLIARLTEGAHRRLTLISAPAGFGKTTLACEWLAHGRRRAAWLSLDDDDNDPARFLSYLIAALQTVRPEVGRAVQPLLAIPQPPIEAALTALANDLAGAAEPVTIVLDDYHRVTAPAIDRALTFLLAHTPPEVRWLIATREDPQLPLHKLRAADDLTELRAADLRFTHAEAAEFLTRAMGLRLSAEDVAALETRTEGWIVGLQLAAVSMQGEHDAAGFIRTFAGSHRFVLDYLVEEVLRHQPPDVQRFLLRTSILERMCGPLCDAVTGAPGPTGQRMLEALEQANLFLVPLDQERRWWRYHHLFAELLRQRLQHDLAAAAKSAPETAPDSVPALHIRAAEWLEDNGLDLEAFHHAAAADDIPRAERLMDGRGIPLHTRGAVGTLLAWLERLPRDVFEARPSLAWQHAALLLVNGHTTGVADKLDVAERALRARHPDEAVADAATRTLYGQIAAARATLALTRYQNDEMLAQSLRALALLPPERASTRANAFWTLGYAHMGMLDLDAARQAFMDALAMCRPAGNVFTTVLATIGLGLVLEARNDLPAAAEMYREVLRLAGDQPLQIVAEPHAGLARVAFEWNDLETARHHAEQSVALARQYDSVIDRFILAELLLARVKLAQGDEAGADALIAHAGSAARQPRFAHRQAEVAEMRARALLQRGAAAEALAVARAHGAPLAAAQAHLALGDGDGALAALAEVPARVAGRMMADERVRLSAMEAVARHLQGRDEDARRALAAALALGEPAGCVRAFAELGAPMNRLLTAAVQRGARPAYVARLLAAFPTGPTHAEASSPAPALLSARELEVLRLIAQGASNEEIGARLHLALDTVKGHNRRIFAKLDVQRRTEAVARAQALGLLGEAR